MLFLVAEGAWIGAAVLAIAAALFDARTGRVPMPLLVPFLIAGCLARLAVPLLLGIPHVDVILASYVGVGSRSSLAAWARSSLGDER